MVSVSTRPQATLTESQAQRSMFLERLLIDLVVELNETVAALQILGIDAKLSLSDDGVAPGNQ